MKFLFPFFVLLVVCSCSLTRKASTSNPRSLIITDSTQYGIIIIDPDFDRWYLVNYTPAKEYSNEYYRARNQVGVINWNDYYARNHFNRVIDEYLVYDNSIDYGIDVNRKLYWYFKFVEENYKIRLIH